MENASKALIIAGAILVSIVIITLGVMIVTNVTDTINNSSNLSEQEILAYNQPFQAYEGTRSGTQVKALFEKIRTHNNAYIDDKSKQIEIVNGDATTKTTVSDTGFTSSDVSEAKKNILSGKTYKITLGYDENSGLIIAVGYDDKKPTTSGT